MFMAIQDGRSRCVSGHICRGGDKTGQISVTDILDHQHAYYAKVRTKTIDTNAIEMGSDNDESRTLSVSESDTLLHDTIHFDLTRRDLIGNLMNIFT